MEILFLIVAVCLSFVGLVGSVVPALPGAPLNFIAIVILYFLKPGLIGDGTLIFFGALTVVAVFADYILPAIKAKKFGATDYVNKSLFDFEQLVVKINTLTKK